MQEALVDIMNEVGDFFGSEYLNLNRRLLTLLIKLQCDHVQQTMMDPEDLFLLQQVIKDL